MSSCSIPTVKGGSGKNFKHHCPKDKPNLHQGLTSNKDIYIHTLTATVHFYIQKIPKVFWVSGPIEHFKKNHSSESFENYQETYLLEFPKDKIHPGRSEV